MEVRRRKSPHHTHNNPNNNSRHLNKTMSNPNLKRTRSPARNKPPKPQFPPNPIKKRIQLLQAPQLLLKIHYKGKKLSVPIPSIESRNLQTLVQPYILRFEKEILKNNSFDFKQIQTWKTVKTKTKADYYLRDYYLQLGKSMEVFKGEVIEIEPVWRENGRKQVGIGDFEIVRCIGTGGFSKVFLVRKRGNGKYYALKVMEKEGLLETGKQCVVTNQRDIMVGLDNPYVLRMDHAFQTPNFIAFALQYCAGGQLFHYLRKVKRLSEDQARYCFIQILTAFKYLHSKNILYRDIKPQNIIIDHDGHLKIADFGLSKILSVSSTHTFCGSPEYMAPEMLKKCGHGFAVDYYCLGALLYELVTGNPPFYSRDVERIYYSIQHEQIDFPSQLSSQLKQLLTGLLIKDPKRRLGSLGGIREILGHPWLRKTKVDDVISKRLPTPIKVDLLSYNFNEEEIGAAEEVFERRLREEEGLEGEKGKGFERMFEGFEFSRVEGNQKERKESNTQHSVKVREGSYQSGRTKTLKKVKSRNKLNEQLVYRARRRPEKSVKKEAKKSRVHSPNPRLQGKGLHRIKSSGALRQIFK